MKHSIALVAALAVSACTTSSGLSTSDVEEILDDFRLDAERLSDRSETPNRAVPTSGRGFYDGQAGIVMDTGPEETIVVGEGTMTARFGRSEIDGRYTDFVGTDQNGAISDYDGTLVVSNGFLDPDDRGNFVGTLRADLRRDSEPDTSPGIRVRGTIAGNFRGDNAQALIAASEDDDNIGLTDGDIADTTVVITGRARN
ncbi:hypothetical protein [Roseisalinus antarcticus]|uniref:Transferrin-binding protein B C-lobe/N-lobe beta barrel domain-containing protein n=1 Tax=Roseisalinus antarcticus TaxID=254357 RepID=A0A1Y5SN49_9RHOB|nr:hypothetical protein [Roseisalinus antarcticus]SLN41560.1 hypothetical protein ROA7023_01667 [Roseisalinus antarcticus]